MDLLNLADSSSSKPLRIFASTVILNSVKKGRFISGSDSFLSQGQICAPDLQTLFSTLGLETKRLITIGSSEEYGAREDDTPILESEPLTPLSSYGYWKAVLFDKALNFADKAKIELLHLRPFVVYGPNQDTNMFMGELIKALASNQEFPMTHGEQYRSFIEISDVVEVIAQSASSRNIGFVALNVSSPAYLQLRDIAGLAGTLCGKSQLIKLGALPYRDVEVWHQNPDLRKVVDMLGEDYRFSRIKDDIVGMLNLKAPEEIPYG